MSTSPKRAPVAADPAELPEQKIFVAPQPFPYDVVSSGALRRPLIGGATRQTFVYGTSDASDESGGAEAASVRETQAARAQGREEGLAEARKNFQEQLARERANVVAALAQFTRDRTVYFAKIEVEVVQLALAIARKILYREAQTDPLLLAGIVHVALEKIDGATGVRLRVHPQNAADWRRYLATHLDASNLPEIIEDPVEPSDRCILETSMGTSVLGLDVQLKEIEQGLMDLLAARPAVREENSRDESSRQSSQEKSP